MSSVNRYVRAPIFQLEKRCNERGYILEKAKACIVEVYPDATALFDVDHPEYPRDKGIKLDFVEGGVGSNLKKLLSRIGITSTPNCSCNARAAMMDTFGIGWCEENLEYLVGFLREEAAKRKLPFIDAAGRALVKMAIKRAKKNIGK